MGETVFIRPPFQSEWGVQIHLPDWGAAGLQARLAHGAGSHEVPILRPEEVIPRYAYNALLEILS